MSRKKKRAEPVMNKKRLDGKIVIKADPIKRKMPLEELKKYLRESKRGTGPHGVQSNKTKRRKARQALKEGKNE